MTTRLGLIVGALVMVCGAQPQPARTVSDNVLTSRADPAVRIQVAPGFKYAGAQRFVLRDVADVEQHFFAEADSRGAFKRAYWIQFEQYLPDRPGEYSYDSDEPMNMGGLPVRVHVRRFTEPPAADSDRRRAFDLLAKAGFSVPTPSNRVRLVFVPEQNKRQEVMTIYLEPAGASDPTPDERKALIQRAMEGISITRGVLSSPHSNVDRVHATPPHYFLSASAR
jgi:hypothetical protein